MTNSALALKHSEEGALANERMQSEQIARKLLNLQIPSAKSDAKLYQDVESMKGAEKGTKLLLPLLLKYLSSPKN